MYYGIRTPAVELPNPSNENEALLLCKKYEGISFAPHLADGLARGAIPLVYDTIDMSKDYQNLENNFYYKRDRSVKLIQARQPYIDSVFRREAYDEGFAKLYDLSIMRDNKQYGVEVKNIGFNGINFSTRDRHVKIIDHIYLGQGNSTIVEPNVFHFEFPYVRKIGVALPSTLYWDISDSYPSDNIVLFSVVDNRFYCRWNGQQPPAKQVGHTPFQKYRETRSSHHLFASDVLIVDLSEVV